MSEPKQVDRITAIRQQLEALLAWFENPVDYLDEEEAATLIRDVLALLAGGVSTPTPSPYVAPDPEPDLPEDECTTAVMLQKVASHLEDGNLVAHGGLDKQEWIDALRDRAARLERRAVGVPPPQPVLEQLIAERAEAHAAWRQSSGSEYDKGVRWARVATLDRVLSLLKPTP